MEDLLLHEIIFEGDTIIWYRIGKHDEYLRLLS